MSCPDPSVRFQHRCVRRASAHIKDGERKLRSRRSHGSEGCHYSLHTGHHSLHVQLLLQLLCNLLHGKMLGFYHGRYPYGLLHTGFSRKRTGDLHRSKRIYRKDIRNADVVILTLGHIRHAGFDPLKHVPYVCIFLSVNITDLSCILKSIHDLVRPGVNVDPGFPFSVEKHFSGGKDILPNVSIRRSDHHRASFSDQAFGNRCHHSCLFRIQPQKGGDSIRIAQHPDTCSGQSHLDGCQLVLRHSADMAHLVNDRNLFIQTVFHKDSFICLKNHSPDIQFRNMLIQSCRRLLIGKFARGHNNIRNARFSLPDIFQEKKISYRLSCSCRSGGVMADHGGFGNNGFRNGLHRRIPDHRSRLVEPH